MPAITAAGGAAPAVIAWIPLGTSACKLGSAFNIVLRTTGAPQKWLTLCCLINSKIASARTCRRHTLVPATAARVHGKHHPLQWNMGSVHRYTGCAVMFQHIALESALR